MKAQVESISPVKTRLSIEVPAEEVAQEEEAAFRDLRRTVAVPGFRKGKAPIGTLKRLYGARVRSDVLSRIIERTYFETLQKEQIVPVSDADIQLQSAGDDGGVAYTAVVEVRPTVEPRGYKNLTLQKERVEVDEVEVDAQLERLRTEHATFEPAPEGHAAETGDLVVIDYEGSVGGEPFEGGRGEDRSIVLGSGMFIPGFEDGIVGARAGEERSVEVTFPEDYRAEELAGKEALFRVQVKEVKVRRLPDLDDEFAREVAEVGTVDELRERVREAIRGEKTSRVERAFRERLIDTLLDANPFEVPESMVRRQQAYSLERLRNDLARRGLDPEALGIDEAKIQEGHRRAAERSVRWAFLLRAIAEAEQIEVTDEDLDERIRQIAEADGRPYSLIRSFFDEEDRLDGLRSSMLETKVLDRVVEASTVEEVEPEQAGEEEGGDE
ncbi:MAG: trigger factor [Deferrisomatales bacterium]